MHKKAKQEAVAVAEAEEEVEVMEAKHEEGEEEAAVVVPAWAREEEGERGTAAVRRACPKAKRSLVVRPSSSQSHAEQWASRCSIRWQL
mmetsp:Transcript_27174/g.63467  ORF Transcript_27174/g.63467 Transcript_27174/m.63467 type:complete len:89 (-) Transcript_27174:560-826(-)